MEAGELKSAGGNDVSLRVSARLEKENDKSWFVVKTMDDGRHFDPQFGRRNPVDTEQHIREREIGGLGLFLIEQSVDKVTYDWVDECISQRSRAGIKVRNNRDPDILVFLNQVGFTS